MILRKLSSLGLAMMAGLLVALAPAQTASRTPEPETEATLEIAQSAVAPACGQTAQLPPSEAPIAASAEIEANGLCFEILLPETRIPIPPNRPDAQPPIRVGKRFANPETETPIQFGLRITNLTSETLSVNWLYALSLEIFDSEGRAVDISKRNLLLKPREESFPVLQPGESTTSFLDGSMFWSKNQLITRLGDPFGDDWIVLNFKPGIYQVRLKYESYANETSFDLRTEGFNWPSGVCETIICSFPPLPGTFQGLSGKGKQ